MAMTETPASILILDSVSSRDVLLIKSPPLKPGEIFRAHLLPFEFDLQNLRRSDLWEGRI